MAWTSSQWNRAWSAAKDVVLTGLGIVAIYTQIFSSHPSGLILGTGLALTVPSIADHVRALLPSSQHGGGGQSSPSLPPPGPAPSLPSPSGTGGTGDPGT